MGTLLYVLDLLEGTESRSFCLVFYITQQESQKVREVCVHTREWRTHSASTSESDKWMQFRKSITSSDRGLSFFRFTPAAASRIGKNCRSFAPEGWHKLESWLVMIPYRCQQIWFWGKETPLASWEVADDHCLFWIALSNAHWGCMSVASFKSARFLRPHTSKEELGACCNMFVDCKKSLRFKHLASHNASTFFSDSSDWWSLANEK